MATPYNLSKTPAVDLAVVIARFQTPYLTSAHEALLQAAVNKGNSVLIMLGTSEVKSSKRNPLDFKTRKMMVADFLTKKMGAEYVSQDVTIVPVPDMPGADKAWVVKVDKFIGTFGQSKVAMFGGRDSFIKVYEKENGRHPCVELDAIAGVSATQLREAIIGDPRNSEDFRAGVIYGKLDNYDHVFPTVDVAIIDFSTGKIILGQKPDREVWCLPGGFADPRHDKSFKDAARRERKEEVTNIEIGEIVHLDSFFVDDSRYQEENSKIITSLFVAPYIFGAPAAGDDLAKVQWFDLAACANLITDNNIGAEKITKNHRQLILAAHAYYEANKSTYNSNNSQPG